jgi:hypothetical protein
VLLGACSPSSPIAIVDNDPLSPSDPPLLLIPQAGAETTSPPEEESLAQTRVKLTHLRHQAGGLAADFIGILENLGSAPLRQVTTTVTLFDSAGQPVMWGSQEIPGGMLLPGQPAPFALRAISLTPPITMPPNGGVYSPGEVSVSWSTYTVTLQAVAMLDATIDRVLASLPSRNLSIVGSQGRLELVALSAYDKTGELVGVETSAAYPDNTERTVIAPGERAATSNRFFSFPELIARYEVQIVP